MNKVLCPISIGELLDKISILRIKLKNIQDNYKWDNINLETLCLVREIPDIIKEDDREYYLQKLMTTNSIIWDLVEKLNYMTKTGDFESGEFATTARAVFEFNNKRFKIKKEINDKFDSYVKEEKSFEF